MYCHSSTVQWEESIQVNGVYSIPFESIFLFFEILVLNRVRFIPSLLSREREKEREVERVGGKLRLNDDPRLHDARWITNRRVTSAGERFFLLLVFSFFLFFSRLSRNKIARSLLRNIRVHGGEDGAGKSGKSWRGGKLKPGQKRGYLETLRIE